MRNPCVIPGRSDFIRTISWRQHRWDMEHAFTWLNHKHFHNRILAEMPLPRTKHHLHVMEEEHGSTLSVTLISQLKSWFFVTSSVSQSRPSDGREHLQCDQGVGVTKGCGHQQLQCSLRDMNVWMPQSLWSAEQNDCLSLNTISYLYSRTLILENTDFFKSSIIVYSFLRFQ